MDTTTECIVSGGAGFIGSHLCDALIARNYKVYCIDNLITGSKKNIQHLVSNSRFRFILHDISKPFAKKQSIRLRNLKFLYHLASPASPPQYRKYSIETLLVNSFGTYYMLELAKKNKARFLVASTSEVYGDPLRHPQKETYFGNVNPVGVRSCYDEGKRFTEAITMEYVRKFGLDCRIIRVFNTYGPRMKREDGRVISNFINQAISGKPLTLYGDGSQTRSFCYISDMVAGIILAMEKEKFKGEVVNLGYPEEYTVKDIARIILHLTNSSSVIRPCSKPEDDPAQRRPEITKAIKSLGWQPTITLQEGLIKTIGYFNSL